MKYQLNQTVYYFLNNKVHSAPVQCRAFVENLHEDWNSTEEQKKLWQAFGPSGSFYRTCHGTFSESVIFESKEDLLASL